ncbi:hypothetical protein FEM48_Zijuj04G0051900 [Ziziphus jujuba var. spinosa]|uniref:UDP-glycosyltransferase 83A1-like n=1 Tax=Ziziphus jujuba var. spinosa TaxID=714518 RepID=A0A978VHZ8_ZIZJJ|nr:hypothetical protein FEM48_Zijuj04G0051900 [Ziziphus jujuba var. spinosa]
MENPHVLVIPYPAAGHVIPLMELSQCLVQHGFKITFVSTEYIHEKVSNSLAMIGDEGNHQVHLIMISDGLSLEDRKKPGKFSETILRIMPGKVEELIEEINGPGGDEITCVLADQSLGWVLEIAEQKGIKRAAFCPAAAALLVQGFSIPKLIDEGVINNDGTPMKKQLSDMPAMNTENFVWTCLGNMTMQKNIFGLMVRNNKSIKLADWLICNSTYDLEPAAFEMAPKVLPIEYNHKRVMNAMGETSDTGTQINLVSIPDGMEAWENRNDLGKLCEAILKKMKICRAAFRPAAAALLALVFSIPKLIHDGIIQDNGTPLRNQMIQLAPTTPTTRTENLVWACIGDVTTQRIIFETMVRNNESMKMADWVLCNPDLELAAFTLAPEILPIGPLLAKNRLGNSYICDVWMVGLRLKRNDSGTIIKEEIKNKADQVLGDEMFKAKALELKEKALNNVNLTGFLSISLSG